MLRGLSCGGSHVLRCGGVVGVDNLDTLYFFGQEHKRVSLNENYLLQLGRTDSRVGCFLSGQISRHLGCRAAVSEGLATIPGGVTRGRCLLCLH